LIINPSLNIFYHIKHFISSNFYKQKTCHHTSRYSDMSHTRLFLFPKLPAPKRFYPKTLLTPINTFYALFKVFYFPHPVQKIRPVSFLFIRHKHHLCFPLLETTGAFISGAFASIFFPCSILGKAASNASAPY